MSSLKFGTSGLRGLASDMSPIACARYVRAFLRYLEVNGKVLRTLIVGRDLRESSPTIANSCLAAVQTAGYNAVDSGALPTPALALEAMRIGVPAIMVTGSHIPAERNGLKFYRPDGEITKADEAGILNCLAEARNNSMVAPAARHVASDAALKNYRNRYLALGNALSLAGMRVGVYQHSSVARDLIVDVLAGLGAEPVPLGRSGTFVAVDTEALTEEDIARVAEWGATHRLDAIVSSDGDADRPLVVDEQGRFLRGDVIGLLTASFLQADTVVTPVTSTSAVELSGLFTRTLRTRVGSPYVVETMAANMTGVVVGFEANGGVLLGSSLERDGFSLTALPTRDALLPIVTVLALAHQRGSTMSQLIQGLPSRFTASGRIEHVTAEESMLFLPLVADYNDALALLGKDAKITRIDVTDGVKLTLSANESLHFRASGNAPELRCYSEASTIERAAHLLQLGLAKAEAAIVEIRG